MQGQRTGRSTAPSANANANAGADGQRSSGTPGASTPYPSASAYKFEYPCSAHGRPTSPEPVAQDTQAFADSLTKALKKAKPFAITISIKTPPSILAKRRNARLAASCSSSSLSSANGSLCPSTIASSVASSKHSPIMDARSHRSEDDFALGL